MLNGERFALSNGFSVIVPTADHCAVDGYRIDQKGVKPDIEIKPDEALDHIMNVLIGR